MTITPTTHTLLGLSPAGFHQLAYHVWQEGSAPLATLPASQPVVVCVHGLTRNGNDFAKLGAYLGARVPVVALDVVGRGQSAWLTDPRHYHYGQYSADAATLLAALGPRPIWWVGTSMGGLLGMVLAAQPNSPITKLVLNDVGPEIPLAAMQRIAAYVGLDPQFSGLAALEAYLRKNYAASGPMTDADFAALAATSARMLPNGKLGLAHDPAIAQNFAALAAPINFWPLYDQIRCPTLLIHGLSSDVLPTHVANAMRERGPRPAYYPVPNIGHIPALMDAGQLGAIEKFLCEH